MIRKVYNALKQESRRGDFVELVQADLQEIKLNMNDQDIQNLSKMKWKTMVKSKINQSCFEYLVNENASKERTREISFKKFELARYLYQNQSLSLCKVIFAARSGTLEIKDWNI